MSNINILEAAANRSTNPATFKQISYLDSLMGSDALDFTNRALSKSYASSLIEAYKMKSNKENKENSTKIAYHSNGSVIFTESFESEEKSIAKAIELSKENNADVEIYIVQENEFDKCAGFVDSSDFEFCEDDGFDF